MASGTGEFDGNTVTTAGGSQFYRYIHITGQDFNHDTGQTTVHYYIGTWVERGSLGGTTVRSEGTCNDSYQVYGYGRYDYHDGLSVTNGHVGDPFHFWERASYTGGSGTWYGSTLDMMWYPDVPSYTLTYYPNGGSGAPSAQTKSWGNNQFVSSTKPTRELYNFVEWNTKADGTGKHIKPGEAWSSNRNLTLYAIWELAYLPPSVSIDECWRVDSSNKAADDGTRLHVKVSYKANTSIDSSNKVKTLYIQYRESNATDWTTAYSNTSLAASSGTYTLNYTGAVISTDKQYDVRAYVTDTYGPSKGVTADKYTAYTSAVVTTAFYTMDFLKGGKGVSIGAPATKEGFNVAMASTFSGATNHTGALTKSSNTVFAGKRIFKGSYSDTHNTAITLDESAANFTFLDIQFTTNDGVVGVQRVYSPNGALVNLVSITAHAGNEYRKSKTVVISGTSIDTYNYNGYWTAENSSNDNVIGITEVWGWK